MPSLFSRLSGVFEIALSVFGAGLLVVQTLSGADGIAQIAAALVALIAPVCAALRETSGARSIEIADAVADAISDALSQNGQSR